MEPMDHTRLQNILGAEEALKLRHLLNGLSDTILQQAAEAARQEDYSQVQQLLQPVLGKEARQLAADLGKRLG